MKNRIAVACVILGASTAAAQDRTLPPESERQLARAIYKEMIEINSGYTTGATTPVVEAVAKRLKAAVVAAASVSVQKRQVRLKCRAEMLGFSSRTVR